MDLIPFADSVTESGLATGVLIAVFLAGLRHGFDIDHVAAISDITSSQTHRKRSFQLATLYALGHMTVLLALGAAAVYTGEAISGAADSFAGRTIGLTLVMLGAYVLYSLVRYRRDFRMRSRWMLIVAGVRKAVRRFRPPTDIVVIEHTHGHAPNGHHDDDHAHDDAGNTLASALHGRMATVPVVVSHSHPHRHVVSVPTDPFTDYGVKTSLFVGMIHGVGAETPTQVLLFTSAAGVAGSVEGLALVALFVFGLLVGNTILAVVASAGFSVTTRLPFLYMGVAAVTAAISIYVGLVYLLARPDLLPAMLGG